MILLGAPYTKMEIVDGLAAEFGAVHAFFEGIDAALFFAAPDGVWSPADNLVHLIQSSRPMTMALNLPKIALRTRFGLAKDESRGLAAVRHEYVQVALAGGGVASGRYLPEVTEITGKERARILAKWQAMGGEVVTAVAAWSEADLDKYLLPHPLLGKMSVREILFFTLYHNMHHVNDVRRLLAQPEVEWFETDVVYP